MLDEQMKEKQKAFEQFCGEVFRVTHSGDRRYIVSLPEYVRRTGIPREKLATVCQAMGLVVSPGRGLYGYTARLPPS